ncbi:hypothetical protein ES703_27986 [subsurface metagenome]
MIAIGTIARSNLKITGFSASSGSRASARSSLSRTSLAFSSIFWPHSNFNVTADKPSFEIEITSSTPLIALKLSSIGSVINVSTSSGPAPSYVVNTEIAGISISGIRSSPRSDIDTSPKTTIAINIIAVVTGLFTETCASLILYPLFAPPRRPSRRLDSACRLLQAFHLFAVLRLFRTSHPG